MVDFGLFDFRSLSLKYHPDKNVGDESAANKFVEVCDRSVIYHSMIYVPNQRHIDMQSPYYALLPLFELHLDDSMIHLSIDDKIYYVVLCD